MGIPTNRVEIHHLLLDDRHMRLEVRREEADGRPVTHLQLVDLTVLGPSDGLAIGSTRPTNGMPGWLATEDVEAIVTCLVAETDACLAGVEDATPQKRYEAIVDALIWSGLTPICAY